MKPLSKAIIFAIISTYFSSAAFAASVAMPNYVVKAAPVAADKVLITDTEDANKTKNATLSSLRAALGLGTSDNPSFNSVHASGGNLAAANKQVTKAWLTGISYTADETSVIHGGQHYICTSNHTAGASTEPGVGASWQTVWTLSGGAGDDLGSAIYSDVVGLWTTCTGYLKNDGTCDTPSGTFTYPGAGIPASTGSAWGTSYTLDTDMSSVSANDDSIPSAKAVDAIYAKKSGISFVAGALADMKILTTAQPVNGENLVDDTVAYGATEDQLRLWSINKVGSQLALKLNATALDDTKGNGDTTYVWSADKVYDQLVLKRSIADEKKEVCWFVTASDTATAVADGKQAFVVPASMNGMLLTDMTCAVHDLNSAASGATTVVLRRVRGATAADMVSTGVTINYDEYSASDETVDTANDDLATGDKVYVDVNAITTAAQKGLTCTAVFSNP